MASLLGGRSATAPMLVLLYVFLCRCDIGLFVTNLRPRRTCDSLLINAPL